MLKEELILTFANVRLSVKKRISRIIMEREMQVKHKRRNLSKKSKHLVFN